MKKEIMFLFLAATGLIFTGCFHHVPPPPSNVVYNFQPSSILRLCPDHVRGDREFKGHGPNVKTTATLERRSSDTEIWVKLTLFAEETKSDWTTGSGNWDKLLWTTPAGTKIVSINSDMTSQASYIDTDHSLDVPAVSGGNLVSKFEIMGDTSGKDVGNCTTDDVYLNVHFNPISGMRTQP
jgi:hypothetical protein